MPYVGLPEDADVSAIPAVEYAGLPADAAPAALDRQTQLGKSAKMTPQEASTHYANLAQFAKDGGVKMFGTPAKDTRKINYTGSGYTPNKKATSVKEVAKNFAQDVVEAPLFPVRMAADIANAPDTWEAVKETGKSLFTTPLGFVPGIAEFATGRTATENWLTNPGLGAMLAVPTAKMGIKGASSIARFAKEPNIGRLNAKLDTEFTKAVRPSVTNTRTGAQAADFADRARTAVKEIVLNKDSLGLTNEFGEAIDGLPKSLSEFRQAIDSTKKNLWRKVEEINSAAGDKGVAVPLQSAANELMNLANDPVYRTMEPNTISYAQDRASALAKQGSFTVDEAQNAVTLANQSLKNFYKNPTADAASRAYVDSLIANHLRSNLDTALEQATGSPAAHGLRQSYGALKAIERDVNQRATVDARKNQRGLADFTDIFTAGELVNALASFNPAGVAKAGTMAGVKGIIKHLNDPNTHVKRLFRTADKLVDKVDIPKPEPYRVDTVSVPQTVIDSESLPKVSNDTLGDTITGGYQQTYDWSGKPEGAPEVANPEALPPRSVATNFGDELRPHDYAPEYGWEGKQAVPMVANPEALPGPQSSQMPQISDQGGRIVPHVEAMTPRVPEGFNPEVIGMGTEDVQLGDRIAPKPRPLRDVPENGGNGGPQTPPYGGTPPAQGGPDFGGILDALHQKTAIEKGKSSKGHWSVSDFQEYLKGTYPSVAGMDKGHVMASLKAQVEGRRLTPGQEQVIDAFRYDEEGLRQKYGELSDHADNVVSIIDDYIPGEESMSAIDFFDAIIAENERRSGNVRPRASQAEIDELFGEIPAEGAEYDTPQGQGQIAAERLIPSRAAAPVQPIADLIAERRALKGESAPVSRAAAQPQPIGEMVTERRELHEQPYQSRAAAPVQSIGELVAERRGLNPQQKVAEAPAAQEVAKQPKQQWEMTSQEYAEQGKPEPLPNDVFYVNGVEVIQNPSPSDYRQLQKEARERFPLNRDANVRFTEDDKGNRFIWKAYDAIHAQIEPAISERIGRKVSQNPPEYNKSEHRREVYRALQDNKTVPAEVLAEYMDDEVLGPIIKAKTAPAPPAPSRAASPAMSLSELVAERRGLHKGVEPQAEPLPESEPFTPPAQEAPTTWRQFVGTNMSRAMKETGGDHGKAMKLLGEEWRKDKSKDPLGIRSVLNKLKDERGLVGIDINNAPPQFKKWFGDSKVVDKDGNPLIVYHGTRDSFDKFSPFSHFGTVNAAAERLDSFSAMRDGENVMPVFLRIKRPLTIKDMGGDTFVEDLLSAAKVPKVKTRQIMSLITKGRFVDFYKAAIEAVESQGFDGFQYVNTVEHKGSMSYIPLRPNQIKSAIGNNGNFNSKNPDIRR